MQTDGPGGRGVTRRTQPTKESTSERSVAKSPLVGPEKPPAPPKPKAANPNGDCDGDGQINRVDTDDDNDLLTDDVEKGFDLDQCKADTDGDKVEDGYEYQSARDLNDDEHQTPNDYIPYPEKRPYPNALDRTDAYTDHDGDDLTLLEEYRLWKVTLENGESGDAVTFTVDVVPSSEY